MCGKTAYTCFEADKPTCSPSEQLDKKRTSARTAIKCTGGRRDIERTSRQIEGSTGRCTAAGLPQRLEIGQRDREAKTSKSKSKQERQSCGAVLYCLRRCTAMLLLLVLTSAPPGRPQTDSSEGRGEAEGGGRERERESESDSGGPDATGLGDQPFGLWLSCSPCLLAYLSGISKGNKNYIWIMLQLIIMIIPKITIMLRRIKTCECCHYLLGATHPKNPMLGARCSAPFPICPSEIRFTLNAFR